MVAEINKVSASGLNLATTHAGSPAVVYAQLFAQSGLVLIPIRCDATGAIENTK